MTHPSVLRTKVEVAAACGMNAAEIGESFRIAKSTVYRWIVPGRHEQSLQASCEWRKANPGASGESNKRWYYSNQERARGFGRSSMKKWRINNPENAKTRDARNYRQQYSRDPERFARKALVRQERMKSFPMSRIERMMCNLYYQEARRLTRETGIKHEVDHVWPLSRGGPHLPWNLQVITSEENRQKSDKI